MSRAKDTQKDFIVTIHSRFKIINTSRPRDLK